MSGSKGVKLLFIAALLQIVWGLVPSASKVVIDEIPIELYIAIRWTISGLIFGAYVWATKSWRSVPPKTVLAVASLGILGYGLASFLTLNGLRVGGVTNFALMGALGPAITSAVAIIVLKERPQKIFYLALPVGMAGLVLLIAAKYELSSFAVAAGSAAYIMAGAFLEALVFVFSKKFKNQMTSTQYLATAQIAGAGFVWLLQILFFRQTPDLAGLSLRGFGAALFVSIVACVLCYAVLYWLLNYIDGHRLALFDSFHTLSATIFGLLFFNEKLTPLMVVGGFFILFGLVAGNWPKNFSAESPE